MANASKETEVKNISASLASPEKPAALAKGLEHASHDIGSRIGEFAGTVSDKAGEYVSSTRSYVKDHPLQSVAIAAATGAVIGSLVTLVSRRKH